MARLFCRVCLGAPKKTSAQKNTKTQTKDNKRERRERKGTQKKVKKGPFENAVRHPAAQAYAKAPNLTPRSGGRVRRVRATVRAERPHNRDAERQKRHARRARCYAKLDGARCQRGGCCLSRGSRSAAQTRPKLWKWLQGARGDPPICWKKTFGSSGPCRPSTALLWPTHSPSKVAHRFPRFTKSLTDFLRTLI